MISLPWGAKKLRYLSIYIGCFTEPLHYHHCIRRKTFNKVKGQLKGGAIYYQRAATSLSALCSTGFSLIYAPKTVRTLQGIIKLTSYHKFAVHTQNPTQTGLENIWLILLARSQSVFILFQALQTSGYHRLVEDQRNSPKVRQERLFLIKTHFIILKV